MLSRLFRTITERALLESGDRVLVGLSGGPDSTALLDGLLTLAPRLGIAVEAACVDHGLRPESSAEAAEVRRVWTERGVPCQVLTVDVRAHRGGHISLQDAARRARLEALEEHAAGRGCVRVALGHTAQDQAETVLFRIVRGTGLAGLAGIPYRRGPFVRPLLDVRREDVMLHLRKRRLPFVDDPSNHNPVFTRTRVRHAWMPFLAKENPRLLEALVSLAGEAQAARREDPTGWPGIPRRLAPQIDRWVQEAAGTHRRSIRGGQIEVRYGQASFVPTPVPDAAAAPFTRIVVAGPGEFPLPRGGKLRVQFCLPGSLDLAEGAALPALSPAWFDAEALSWPLCLRTRVPGDRMRPRGGRGGRKLSDLFIDAKIPQPDRSTWPVLAGADGTIFYVPGLRPSEVARPGPKTRQWVQVHSL